MNWVLENGSWVLLQILVGIPVIGVLIFVHELGHFLVAKWCNVGVVRFAVGFGPALLKFTRAETQYQLGIIPLGGYVRMVGDMPDMITGSQPTDEAVRHEQEELDVYAGESPELLAILHDRSRWFVEKNLWQRSAIVFAGPLFNFIFAILVMFLTAFIFGEDRPNPSPRIGKVQANSPAFLGGLRDGDLVQSIAGTPVASWTDLAVTIHKGPSAPIPIVVERAGESLTLTVTPLEKQQPTLEGYRSAFFIGVEPSYDHFKVGVIDAGSFACRWVWEMTRQTYIALFGMLQGKVSGKELSGPLFILEQATTQAQRGFDNLLIFMSILSVSLAVLNLLPIPILDGGHLLFFFIEAVLGPISVRKKEFAQQFGMLLLISLMVFAIHNDITRDRKSMQTGISWDEPDANKAGKDKASKDQAAQEQIGKTDVGQDPAAAPQAGPSQQE